jgi:hypothetical protein
MIVFLASRMSLAAAVSMLLLGVAASAANTSVENRFAAWLAGADRSAATLSAALQPQLHESGSRDLGFGLRRVRFAGQQVFAVEATLLDGNVVHVRANPAGAEVEREFDRSKLLLHLSRTTGARSVGVPAALVAAYDALFFPYDELQIGWSCGWTRKPAAGRPEIEQLIRAARFDLIENILLGGNPEGRVYAARALDGRESSREVRSRVDAVFASPLLIRHCSADVIRSSPAADLRRRPATLPY